MPVIQLLGDSQLNRFKNYILAHNSLNIKLHATFTISGVTIATLKNNLKSIRPKLDPGITTLLFIGSNDIVKNLQYENFIINYLALLRFLNRVYGFHRLLIMKIPAFPRFANNPRTQLLIHKINQFLSTLQSNTISILHLPLINGANLIYFEQFYGNSYRRDLLHLNNLAFNYIATVLVQQL